MSCPPARFKLQYKLCKDEQGRDLICDAVILLEKGKMLPVDSKFSLENYNRLLEETDKTQRGLLAKSFKADLKKTASMKLQNIFVRMKARWITRLCSFRRRLFIMTCWLTR